MLYPRAPALPPREPLFRPDTREIELTIEGMSCAACAVRIEKKLNKIERRHGGGELRDRDRPRDRAVPCRADAHLRDRGRRILRPGQHSGPDARRAGGRAGRRVPAPQADRRLVFFVPLTDLSCCCRWCRPTGSPAGGGSWSRCAAPVALWAAWPFHRAALRTPGTAPPRWTRSSRWASSRPAGGPATRCSPSTAAGPPRAVWWQLTHGYGGGIYLEVAASVTTFLLAGRLYEARARRTAGAAMRELAAAGAKDVCLLETDGTERQIPAGRLRPGDMFVVRPGDHRRGRRGAVRPDRGGPQHDDGGVGPRRGGRGGRVVGGTIALTGRLVVRAVKVGPDTQLAHLIRLVEQAQAEKAAIQRLATASAGCSSRLVLAFAVLTLAGWLLAGSPAGTRSAPRSRS